MKTKILLKLQDLFNKRPEKIHFAFKENPDGYAKVSLAWRYGSLLSFWIHAIFLVIFYFINVHEMVYFNIISMLIFLIGIFLLRSGFFYTFLSLAMAEIVTHAIFASYYVGWDSGYSYYIFVVLLGLFLNPLNRNFLDIFIKLSGTVISISSLFLGWVYLHSAVPVYVQSIEVMTFIQGSNLIMFSSGISLLALTFGVFVVKAEKLMQNEKIKVQKAYSLLSIYVPPQLTETILDGQIDSIWEHNRKKLTLFFSDIKDFTMITDALEPEDMATLLNEYLTEMNKIINKYQGTLAQVIGDGLYVFFGAPSETNDKDHAIRCLKMAIDMQSKMKELSKKWFDAGIEEELQIRCGINTGMATVGGYGSSERKEYTAMGMQVNIAARLESACNPGLILISHSTWALVKEDIPCTAQGQIEIKGYHRPLKVYEVDPAQAN